MEGASQIDIDLAVFCVHLCCFGEVSYRLVEFSTFSVFVSSFYVWFGVIGTWRQSCASSSTIGYVQLYSLFGGVGFVSKNIFLVDADGFLGGRDIGIGIFVQNSMSHAPGFVGIGRFDSYFFGKERASVSTVLSLIGVHSSKYITRQFNLILTL